MLLVKTEDKEEHELFSYLLLGLDYLTFAWFTIELLVNFISCSNRVSFLFSVTTLIDLLTLITYAVQFQHGLEYHKPNEESMTRDVIKTDYQNIEIFSIIRLFRLQKFFRLSIGLQIFKHTLIASSKELLLLVMLLLIPVAIFASIVYFFEREVSMFLIMLKKNLAFLWSYRFCLFCRFWKVISLVLYFLLIREKPKSPCFAEFIFKYLRNLFLQVSDFHLLLQNIHLILLKVFLCRRHRTLNGCRVNVVVKR